MPPLAFEALNEHSDIVAGLLVLNAALAGTGREPGQGDRGRSLRVI